MNNSWLIFIIGCFFTANGKLELKFIIYLINKISLIKS